MNKSILFITWDGPETSYLEGLFLPIFSKIETKSNFKFFILQFGWYDQKRLKKIRETASNCNIVYKYVEIPRKPSIHFGTFYTIVRGAILISRICKLHNIDIIMPRSIFPAAMVNISRVKLPRVYDSDGFPIEERLENSSLRKNSKLYRLMKFHEQKILKSCDTVLTRSHHAIGMHLITNPELSKKKFFKVINGRDEVVFKHNLEDRRHIRKKLGFGESEVVFVYCGSIGPKYAIKEMIAIFSKYHKKHPHSKLLILTSQKSSAEEYVSVEIENSVIIDHANSSEVPKYMSSADIGLALIYPLESMKGVAPIKLGEYLLMNLYVIASKGIGDVQEILSDSVDYSLIDLKKPNSINHLSIELEKFDLSKTRHNRLVGLNHFSLAKSVSSYLEALSSYK